MEFVIVKMMEAENVGSEIRRGKFREAAVDLVAGSLGKVPWHTSTFVYDAS